MSVTVYYGEDTVRIDQDLLSRKKSYATNELFEELPEMNVLTGKLMTQNLFAEKKLFVFKNVFLFQVNRGKYSKKIEDIMKFLASTQPAVDVVFVEDDAGKAKHYKVFFPKGEYKNYSLPAFIFSYLDNLKPGNFLKLNDLLQKSIASSAAEIIFFMTKRRIKELLQLSTTGTIKGNYQPWQLGKLKSQALSWTSEKLTSFYNNLYKVEKAVKTGQTPYTMQQNLEILLALYV